MAPQATLPTHHRLRQIWVPEKKPKKLKRTTERLPGGKKMAVTSSWRVASRASRLIVVSVNLLVPK